MKSGMQHPFGVDMAGAHLRQGATEPVVCAPTTPAVEKCWDSEQLLLGGREILIRHQHQVYRLQVTRQGKLILTK
jgi:hemin uptake protein HemP